MKLIVGKSRQTEFKNKISDMTRYGGNDGQEEDIQESGEIDIERQISENDSIQEMEDGENR